MWDSLSIPAELIKTQQLAASCQAHKGLVGTTEPVTINGSLYSPYNLFQAITSGVIKQEQSVNYKGLTEK